MLSPIPQLREQAESRFGPQKDYGDLLVGDQVKRYVCIFYVEVTYCIPSIVG